MSAAGPSTDRAFGGSLHRARPVPPAVASPPGTDSAAARRAVDALQELRSQLAETQDVLDDFLTRLDDAGHPRHRD